MVTKLLGKLTYVYWQPDVQYAENMAFKSADGSLVLSLYGCNSRKPHWSCLNGFCKPSDWQQIWKTSFIQLISTVA